MIEQVLFALLLVFILTKFIQTTHNLFIDDRIFVEAFDGRKYKVRNTSRKQETATALARLNVKVEDFITRLRKKEENNNEYRMAIERLRFKYNPNTLSEGKIDKRYTSYTVNKGEEMVLCLRTRDEKDEIYDDNIIFYVTLHELAHIASVTENHSSEFHKNFRFFLRKASEWNMFNHVKNKFHYCGMDVNGT